MATKIITHNWKLDLPNAFLTDHSMSDGNQRDQTYDGPDKIFLQINAEGREVYGPLTEDDIADGRPKPADVVQWYEVDCASSDLHALICQLRGPVVNEKEEDRGAGTDTNHPGSPEVDGSVYPQFTYSSTLFPDDFFDYDSIRVANPGSAGPNDITIGNFTPRQKLNGVDEDKTWEHVRAHRDNVLANSDGQLAEDMPDALKDQWKAYRQSLRDLPNKMIAAGVHPNFADLMFPFEPGFQNPPADPEPDADGATPWQPPNSI